MPALSKVKVASCIQPNTNLPLPTMDADSVAIIAAGATAASAIVAAVYTFATFRILKANRAVVEAMRAQTVAHIRPYVELSVSIRTGTQLLYLTAKNTGKTPAWKLRLVMDHPFHSNGDRRPERNIASWSAFSQVIECLPPATELRFDLGSAPNLFAESTDRNLVPLVFEIVATYSFEGLDVSEQTTIDLRPYLNTAVPHHPIVEELERTRRVLDQIRTTLDRQND